MEKIKLCGSSFAVSELADVDLGTAVLQDLSILGSCGDAELLVIAVGYDAAAVGKVARRLLSGAKLVAVYPGQNQKAPAGAQLLGVVPDGALYISQ